MPNLIKELTVKDFQSVGNAHVDLGLREGGGGLTLIVGPSSTGKSAVLRAAKLLAYNSGSVPVRQGQKKTNIALGYDDGMTVEVERGKSLSTYRLGTEVYQKAGVNVPSDVQKFLGLYDTAHFAFQFDLPYLLGEAGAAVTKALGIITNAHVLTEAAREGARRKSQANLLAKTHAQTAEQAAEALEAFKGLPAWKTLIASATEALEDAQEAETEALSLAALIVEHDEKTERLERAREAAAKQAPNVSELLATARTDFTRAERLTALVTEYERKVARVAELMPVQADTLGKIQEVAHERTHLLKSMGVCPTCGKEQ